MASVSANYEAISASSYFIGASDLTLLSTTTGHQTLPTLLQMFAQLSSEKNILLTN